MLSPRDPVLGGMVRTSGRMIAGGMRTDRRWSESAIPRIGKPRLRQLGAPPTPPAGPPLFVEVSFDATMTSDVGGGGLYDRGYFRARLFSNDPYASAWSDELPMGEEDLPAHTRIRFTFPGDRITGSPTWDYVEVYFTWGDGFSLSAMYDGAYGVDPDDWAGSLVGVTPPPYGRLVDPAGLITP